MKKILIAVSIFGATHSSSSLARAFEKSLMGIGLSDLKAYEGGDKLECARNAHLSMPNQHSQYMKRQRNCQI